MKMGQIVAVREKSAAAVPNTGVLTPRTTETGQKLEGDVIEKVEVKDSDGKVIVFEKGTNLDPVRLPYQLKQWAQRLWAAPRHQSSECRTQGQVVLEAAKFAKRGAGLFARSRRRRAGVG